MRPDENLLTARQADGAAGYRPHRSRLSEAVEARRDDSRHNPGGMSEATIIGSTLRTRTSLAHLLLVLVTALGQQLSTMIILRRRSALAPDVATDRLSGVTAACEHDR